MDGSADFMDQPDTLSIIQLAASGRNIADMLDEGEIARIGMDAVRLYRLDRESMSDWLKMSEKGIDLAKLVATEKTYPWESAANVRYPLVTTAALQFNARSYPAIVPADGEVVKCKTYGKDRTGQKAARGERVAAHMSFDLLNNVPEWEEETDRLLVQLPIVGTMVRKVWHDAGVGRKRVRLLNPGAFIVNDNVSSLDDAPRCTEEFSLYPYELATKKRAGSYRDVEYSENESDDDDQAPLKFIEQHCRLDLDGDGYEEPYIVTVHVETETVARVVGDYRLSDVHMGQAGVTSIKANTYFVPYHFMPAIGGGFWGTGFGMLLGGISETVNSLINMMLDAGHMASLGGGFLGSDFRIKGGAQRFRPGEWKMAPAKGNDIRSAVVPMTFPGADAVLFQLLGMLIESGNDVAGIKDVLMGETGGHQMTATATLALIEQGMQQFTAIYKRVYRSLRQEFKLVARINAETVTPQDYNAFLDETGPDGQPMMFDPRMEYGMADMDICPVADPRSVSKMQEAAKAQVVMELAQNEMVSKGAAADRVMQAASIPDREELIPQPDPMQEAMAEMQMETAHADLVQKKVDVELTLAKVTTEQAKAAEMMQGAELDKFNANLAAMKLMLEDRRERLGQIITARSKSMAGK